MQKDIENGIVKPLERKVFQAAEIEQAFRYLESGKHMGKVLLQIRKDENKEDSLPMAVNPQLYCDPKISYVSFCC
jgi:fatty acid synthase